jgi:hypothetical protein
MKISTFYTYVLLTVGFPWNIIRLRHLELFYIIDKLTGVLFPWLQYRINYLYVLRTDYKWIKYVHAPLSMETITHVLNKNTSKNRQCVNCGNEIHDSSIHDILYTISGVHFICKIMLNHVSETCFMWNKNVVIHFKWFQRCLL